MNWSSLTCSWWWVCCNDRLGLYLFLACFDCRQSYFDATLLTENMYYSHMCIFPHVNVVFTSIHPRCILDLIKQLCPFLSAATLCRPNAWHCEFLCKHCSSRVMHHYGLSSMLRGLHSQGHRGTYSPTKEVVFGFNPCLRVQWFGLLSLELRWS